MRATGTEPAHSIRACRASHLFPWIASPVAEVGVTASAGRPGSARDHASPQHGSRNTFGLWHIGAWWAITCGWISPETTDVDLAPRVAATRRCPVTDSQHGPGPAGRSSHHQCADKCGKAGHQPGTGRSDRGELARHDEGQAGTSDARG